MDTEANETMAERPEVYGFLAPVLMIAMLVIAFVGASIGWIDLAEQANLTDIGLTTIVLLVAGVIGLAARPTISSSLGSSGSTAAVVLASIVAIFAGQEMGYSTLSLAFAITLLIVHLFERNGQNEEANIAFGAITGFVFALTLGANAS
ncbi:MAG: hypothetical protein CMA02_01905, partial [Euryarchaeota archaeon]|nr:hypothetical protein [Euryarchaeota archaeon]